MVISLETTRARNAPDPEANTSFSEGVPVLAELPALSDRQMIVEVPASKFGSATRASWLMSPQEQLSLAGGDEVFREEWTDPTFPGGARKVYIGMSNVMDPEGFTSAAGFSLVTVVRNTPFEDELLAGLQSSDLEDSAGEQEGPDTPGTLLIALL
jgi:hypothetical protein